MEGWGDARTEPGSPGNDAGLGAERRDTDRGIGTGRGIGIDRGFGTGRGYCIGIGAGRGFGIGFGTGCGSGRRAVRRTRQLPA
ncbi:hypothetical protein [Streptosporangium sandarakinum]|uniref:hypothetical protein n=1 Tax=Streptosporangium sandarakinum TaxID=1260955 RepID=UPI003447E6D6